MHEVPAKAVIRLKVEHGGNWNKTFGNCIPVDPVISINAYIHQDNSYICYYKLGSIYDYID